MMRQLTKVTLLCFLLGFGQVVGAAPAGADGAYVAVAEVSFEPLGEGIHVSGLVQSRYDIELSATVEGELKWVLEPGTLVSQGTVVAQVDDAQLKLLLAEQQVMLARANVNHDYLAGEARRLAELQLNNLASDTQLAELKSRQALAAAERDAAAVRVQQLEERLARTRVIAPVAGVIAARSKQGGEFANRGEVLLRIVDPAALEVSVAVPVRHAARMVAGERLEVIADERRVTGVLRAVIYAATRASQTVEVLIDLPDIAAGQVVDGQFAEVRIPLASDEQVLLVPRDAVILRNHGSYVFRIGNDNVAERVDVVLGEGRGERVSVSGKLAAGDRVAIRGAERLNDGQSVQLDPVWSDPV